MAPLITRAEAQKAVDRANEILKQAKIRLEVADFHDGPKDPFANAGNADADGKMTEKDVKDAKDDPTACSPVRASTYRT